MQHDIQLITGKGALCYRYTVAVSPHGSNVYFPVLLPAKLITLIWQ